MSNVSTLSIAGRALGRSLVLLTISILLTASIGPLLGITSVSLSTGRIKPHTQVLLTVGSSVPSFFLGTLAIAFVIYLARASWYPGRGSLLPVQGFGLTTHLIFPVLTLSLRPILLIAHLTAGLIEDEFHRDYVQVAHSKGLPWSIILWRHIVPNILSPVLISIGQGIRILVSTLILVEALFDWRGIGGQFVQVISLTTDRTASRLFLNPELLALVLMLLGAILLLADLLTSTLAYLADPRLRRTPNKAYL